MYTLEEIIRMNNPKGDHKDWIEGRTENENVRKCKEVLKINLSDLSLEEKQKKLKELFEGR